MARRLEVSVTTPEMMNRIICDLRRRIEEVEKDCKRIHDNALYCDGYLDALKSVLSDVIGAESDRACRRPFLFDQPDEVRFLLVKTRLSLPH
jgi:hypothetical protein